MKILILISFIFLNLFASNNVQQEDMLYIKPNDSKIKYSGAFFIEKSDSIAILNRFDSKTLKSKQSFMNPTKANTQTGISIAINTNSPKVVFHFSSRTDTKNRGSVLEVYKDGELVKSVRLTKDKAVEPIFIENKEGAQWAEWKVLLPQYYGLNFLGIEIDKNSDYKAIKSKKKPVYVSIGNSITHGTGQKSSSQTYPYLLAQKKNWDLYNVAVGGSKISWPVAEMLNDKDIDVITILWGYNDWNAGYTLDDQIGARYKKLLEILLKNHPKTNIYCIIPTFTTRTSPKKGSVTIEQIREKEAQIVKDFQQKGYDNIFLIQGNELTDKDGLNDQVHFSVKGAAKFANTLNELINIDN